MTMPQGTNRSSAPARTPRMTLSAIQTVSKPQPKRILIYAKEKEGKTTLAAGAPAPIFICPEDGLPPELSHIPHFPQPDGGWVFEDVVDAVRALVDGAAKARTAKEPFQYQTLVLDTADWIEPLIWKSLFERHGWTGIEDPGFGKGYVAALDEWRKLIVELEQLRAVGIDLVILAHSVVRAFKDPESEGFDRYELTLHKSAAGLLKQWVDAILFLKSEIGVVPTEAGKPKSRKRGVATGARILHTDVGGAFDSGNRWSLPPEILIPAIGGWQTLEAEIARGPLRRAEQLRLEVEKLLPRLSDEDAGKVRDAIERANGDGAKLMQLYAWATPRCGKAVK